MPITREYVCSRGANILYCADCGGKLHFKNQVNGYGKCYVYYVCRNSRSFSESNAKCTPHSIRNDILEPLVLTDIKRVFALVKESESRFVELMRKESRKETEKAVRKAKNEYAKAENRVKQLDGIIEQLYEDKVSGQLSAERFGKMLEKYEAEQAQQTVLISELRPVIESAEEELAGIDRFVALVKSRTEPEELTADVVNELIERVEVGETEIVEKRQFAHWGDKTQQVIRIIYNYIGTVPSEPDEKAMTEYRGKTTTTT